MKLRNNGLCGVIAALAIGGIFANPASAGDKKVGAAKRADLPKGAIVLFDGTEKSLTDNWVKRRSTTAKPEWILKAGAMMPKASDITTKQEFGDFHLHLEFNVPFLPNNHGQARGNSGIGIHGRYEIQILDSYGAAIPGSGDCGAVYSRVAPLVNATLPPKTWETYDIMFRAPRFEGDKVTQNPRVTVILNGQIVQNNTEIPGMTGIQFEQYKSMAATGPIVLQDHGYPVQFRNIWIVPLPAKGSDLYEAK